MHCLTDACLALMHCNSRIARWAGYLTGKPLLKDCIEAGKACDPGHDLSSKGLCKGGCAHGPALDDVIIQQGLCLVQGSPPQDVGACGLPFCQLKRELLPVSMHLVQGLLNGPLPAGLLADLLNCLQTFCIHDL